jgi:hypothetical protein
MSWLAVNNSSKAGTVFFGKDTQTVGPHGKATLQAKPTFWTSNIQLVKSITRDRSSAAGHLTGAGDEVAGDEAGEGVNNG